MAGKTIYFTEKERILVLQAVRCYIETMVSGEETNSIVTKELEDGLEKAMEKLRKTRK